MYFKHVYACKYHTDLFLFCYYIPNLVLSYTPLLNLLILTTPNYLMDVNLHLLSPS